jgi:hypothetical protein
MTYRVASILLLFLVVFTLAGCDKATPVAPDGSILAISANPTKIALNGSSTITIIGRKPDGQPLNPGTEIRLSATNGSIPSFVTTNSSGTAIATFQSNGTPGTATITAAAGTGGTPAPSTTPGSGSTGSSGGTLSASVSIQVGTSAKSITLQPTPTTIPSTGGQVTLLAIVRDANGQPQANQDVNFGTDLGTLNSRGAIVKTDANGQARDRLTVTEGDLANNATSVHVTAQTAGSDGALISTSSTIQVQTSRPIAAFDYAKGSTDLEVVFTARATGTGALSYTWDFGDGDSATTQNPRHTYRSAGDYTVQLTVTDPNSGLSDTAVARITVPVTTPGSGT